MIWIIWHLFIAIDILTHWYIIERLHKSPNKVLATVWRAAVCVGLGLAFGFENTAQIIVYLIGCGSTFVLFFNTGLNKARGKELHHLGSGPVDKLLALIPSFGFRIFMLVVISAGMIHAYYNTDLL
jgi:lipoprotein signal peptidase